MSGAKMNSSGMAGCAYRSATRAGVRRGAYATVTLPSGGDGLSSIFVEVYSAEFTLKQIKAFIRSLVPGG